MVTDAPERMLKLLERLSKPRRDLVMTMLAGPVGTSFMVAPASSREEYHNCFPGGLVDHSVRVAVNLSRIAECLRPGVYQKETLIFVGLFHDLGKAGDGEHEYYIPNPADWQRKRGELYTINRACTFMPVGERSIFLLNRAGVVLTADEHLAVRLADGQYVRENEPYRGREPELALMTHWADHFSMREEKLARGG